MWVMTTSFTVPASTPISASPSVGVRRKVRLRFFAMSAVKPVSTTKVRLALRTSQTK